MATEQYHGLGRRKTSVARVWLKPGTGEWTVNGRSFEDYFPRETLRMIVEREEEIERYRDPQVVEKEFLRQMTRTLERWNDFALRKDFGGDSILVAAGNDDPFGIDPILKELPVFRWVEGQSIELSRDGASYVMVSCGYSNRTPWETPRELDEDELERHLFELLQGVDPQRCILNAHVPPWDSGLDTGPDIDPHSTPKDVVQRKGGVSGPMTKPVGSVAVRRVIEEIQPLLSLHGHIHESRGSVRIGETLCINPGSDYGESVLRGALVRLDEQGIVTHQLTSG
jgi:uncharacterized protein